MSQREIARVLEINPKTVVRKFRFAVATAKDELRLQNQSRPQATSVEFDDLETFEHTRLKPLSVTLMVEKKTRRILGLEVSQMPAKGLLVGLAKKRYGHRRDERAKGRARLFQNMQELVAPRAEIWSDSNPHYGADVKKYFPKATHITVMGGRAALSGQGELKKKKFDPIFALNHTCAMLRAHVNRLIRKTWCTTKRPDQLHGHLLLYALEHNARLSTG